MTSIIEAVQTYVKTYSSLVSGAPVWVDLLEPNPTSYSIVALPGARTVETYLDSSKKMEFPFAFQSMESTADDPARLSNIGFYEFFADWLDYQTEAGTLPTLGTGKTAEKIEATIGGYLAEQGESQTGIYSITCKLTYLKDA
jgi:hypothetical protein